jgi:2-polyprenyl-6-methoxyphenol hydroxylase-like FAD-dependent oxidoreductase
VIGADGKHSLVARAVAAARYRQRPTMAFACYSYWSGLSLDGGEIYQRPGCAVAVFPTNDELVMVYMAAPLAGFDSFRADIEGNFLRTLDRCGDLGERARSGVRAERLRTTPDQPNTFRACHGPGWALVGDAGVVMDSISAQGITNALRDAELLAQAVVVGLAGERPLSAALAEHQRRRDAAIRPMYDFTVGLATFAPPSLAQRQLLASLVGRPAETDRFIGAFTGIDPGYFAPGNVLRVLGLRGVTRIAAAAARRRRGSLLPAARS